MDVGEITLRIVHVNDVIPHEGLDPLVVKRLADRIRDDKILRNPPVVSEAEGRYILLDGATRIGALKLLCARDALVQVVDYGAKNVSLDAWKHLIQRMSPGDLLDEIAALDGVTVERTELKQAERDLAIRKILCCIMLRNGAAYSVRGSTDLHAGVQQLNALVHLYAGRTEVYRAVNTQLDLLLNEYPDLSVLVVFPRFTPAEVTKLALNGARLPMGITRHLISGRALGTNISLERLAADEPLEDKNAWLDRWLLEKIHSRKARFYQEPVFVFDE